MGGRRGTVAGREKDEKSWGKDDRIMTFTFPRRYTIKNANWMKKEALTTSWIIVILQSLEKGKGKEIEGGQDFTRS